MSIFRTNLGNDLDVTITAVGDGNSWTDEQLTAWNNAVAACTLLKQAFRPKPLPTPLEIITDVLDDLVHMPNVVAEDVIMELGRHNLVIVGMGAKVEDKPKPLPDRAMMRGSA